MEQEHLSIPFHVSGLKFAYRGIIVVFILYISSQHLSGFVRASGSDLQLMPSCQVLSLISPGRQPPHRSCQGPHYFCDKCSCSQIKFVYVELYWFKDKPCIFFPFFGWSWALFCPIHLCTSCTGVTGGDAGTTRMGGTSW